VKTQYKDSLISLGLLALLSTQAQAFSLNPNNNPWTGIELGVQGGVSNGKVDWRYTNPNYFNTLGPEIIGTDFTLQDKGAMAGVHAGFNFQSACWVYGIEANASYTDIKEVDTGSFFPFGTFFPAIDTYENEIRWYATGTALFGYTHNNWLLYGILGWAGADLHLHVSDSQAGIVAATTHWSNGWVWGGGMKYKLTPCLSAGIAFEVVKLSEGNTSLTCQSCGTGEGFGVPIVTNHTTIETVKAYINYFFNV